MNRNILRLANVLFGVMTIACFGGPFLIGTVLKGGDSSDWPPDRTVEWVAFSGVTGAVIVSAVGLLAIGIANIRSLLEAKALLDAKRKADTARGDT